MTVTRNRVWNGVHTAAAIGLITLVLSGCAYKPLKAPCAPDEGGVPLSYAEPPSPSIPEPFRKVDPCGPMKPI